MFLLLMLRLPVHTLLPHSQKFCMQHATLVLTIIFVFVHAKFTVSLPHYTTYEWCCFVEIVADSKGSTQKHCH